VLSAAPVNPFSERSVAAYSDFSIDDYGKADDGPYQVVMPTYKAPKWLKTYAEMGPALRECGTLCTLKGVPFRVVRWGREGSGAAGGIPCAACKNTTPNPARFPRHVRCTSCRGGCRSCGARRRLGPGYLPGFPDAHPIAEFRPNGQRLVFDLNGVPQLVGRPNYVVSHNPFPRLYRREVYPQRYLEAVRAAQAFANGWKARAFVVDKTRGTPVGFVDPGLADNVLVTPISPEYFQELVAESRGRSYLGQGA
jgi:hypothetical protein